MTYKIRSLINSKRKIVGALGEALVVKHLKNKGFTHVMSNFLRKQGELDVIMENEGVTHFMEVKTVSREISPMGVDTRTSVIRETVTRETGHRPEENVSPRKLGKIAKMIQIYLGEYGLENRNWQFDVAVVFLDQKNKKAYIKFIKDIPLNGS